MDSVKTVTALRGSVEIPTATLVIRCTGKRAEVFVDVHEVVDQEAGVRIKFDDGKPVKQFWSVGSYEALFSRDAGDFLRSIRTAKIFYFEYSPHQRVPRVVSFDVTKFPDEMGAACVDTAISQATIANGERLKAFAQQKRVEETNEKRLADLRTKCSSFANESLEYVERAVAPLPPQDCWEVLDWMREAVSYDDLVKRRKLCELDSFAKDESFCGPKPSE